MTEERHCPDDGTCHHSCGTGPCFRVLCCAPLSEYGESWKPAHRVECEAAQRNEAAALALYEYEFHEQKLDVLFSECDEHYRALARVALSAADRTQATLIVGRR